MRGSRALLLGIRFGLALGPFGGVACGVLDVNRPGPPPPCPSGSAAPPGPLPAAAPPATPPRGTADPHSNAAPASAPALDASGVRSDCVSEEGACDLTGNVAEWVRRDGPAPRPGYEHVLKGGYWAGCYHEPEPNCVFRNAAHPGTFRTYEAGFRCCRALTATNLEPSRSQ